MQLCRIVPGNPRSHEARDSLVSPLEWDDLEQGMVPKVQREDDLA